MGGSFGRAASRLGGTNRGIGFAPHRAFVQRPQSADRYSQACRTRNISTRGTVGNGSRRDITGRGPTHWGGVARSGGGCCPSGCRWPRDSIGISPSQRDVSHRSGLRELALSNPCGKDSGPIQEGRLCHSFGNHDQSRNPSGDDRLL
jgi:hypothetical protein